MLILEGDRSLHIIAARTAVHYSKEATYNFHLSTKFLGKMMSGRGTWETQLQCIILQEVQITFS